MSGGGYCVVFCGYKGSGKDTFTAHLVENYNFTRYAFADTLKDYCAEKYLVPRSYFDDPAKKDQKIPINILSVEAKLKLTDDLIEGEIPYKRIASKLTSHTPRDLCLIEGKHYRELNPNHWIELMLGKIDREGEERVVVSDCRFPNEIRAMQQKFGKRCFVVWVRRWDAPSSDDVSENSLSAEDCDYTLDNTGELEYLSLEKAIRNRFGL